MLIKICHFMCLEIFIIIFIFSSFALSAETDSRHKIDTYIRNMPSRGVDAQSGKVRIMDSDIKYSYEAKLFEKLPVEFSLEHQYISLENSTVVELPAHLFGLSTGAEATFPFLKFDKTYLRLGMFPSFYSDDLNFHPSSFRIPMRAFLIYKAKDNLTLVGGVAVYPDFDREVWPILGFIYKFNDRLTFDIVPRRPNITYIINDRVSVFGEGSGIYNEFEVTNGDLKNVVLRYQALNLGAGVKLKLNKFFQSSISIGGVFKRRLKYRDTNLGKINIKNGFYSELRLKAAF